MKTTSENNSPITLSIVIPVYKAENIVTKLVERLLAALNSINEPFEIILVEDGSPDLSWNLIEKCCSVDARIKGIKLSRNFGQHHAITAGLDYAKGEWVVVMDCDLQDRPEEIGKLLKKALEGFDIVFARRVNRQDTYRKKLGSKIFYSTFKYLSGIEQDGTIGNFGIYNKKVIQTINQMREPMRAFLPMAKWVGFNTGTVDIQHDERFDGKSSYNLSKLLQLALDAAIAHSDKPLKLTIKLGFSISLLSILYAIYNLSVYLMGLVKLSGYTSLIISIWFLSGLIIFTLGIIGLYISKIFEGIKARPIYIVDKRLNHQ